MKDDTQKGEGRGPTLCVCHLQDPYANAYSSHWRDPATLPKSVRAIGRGGWVATRNYELDSGAYYLNMLWNYLATPGLFGGERFLNETSLFDAAMLLVDTWVVEQRHEERSPYRYSELPRDGLGPPSAYTGMSWSGYRPSDDPQTYSYNVPVNMYAVGALERALEINRAAMASCTNPCPLRTPPPARGPGLSGPTPCLWCCVRTRFMERCDGAAEVGRLERIKEREGGGGRRLDPLHYETLNARIRHGAML